jgi:hypothetical protein
MAELRAALTRSGYRLGLMIGGQIFGPWRIQKGPPCYRTAAVIDFDLRLAGQQRHNQLPEEGHRVLLEVLPERIAHSSLAVLFPENIVKQGKRLAATVDTTLGTPWSRLLELITHGLFILPKPPSQLKVMYMNGRSVARPGWTI